jgi:hypothetical protein
MEQITPIFDWVDHISKECDSDSEQIDAFGKYIMGF